MVASEDVSIPNFASVFYLISNAPSGFTILNVFKYVWWRILVINQAANFPDMITPVVTTAKHLGKIS